MIVCDFEGTVFDEAKLRHDYRRIFASYGLDFDSIYRRTAKHGHFSLESLNRTTLKKNAQIKIIAGCHKLLEKGAIYVYPDALEFLKKNTRDVALLSFGGSHYQKEKILGSGVAKYFAKIEITSLHKKESKNLLSSAKIYIDNDPTAVKEIVDSYPKLKVYLVDRTGEHESMRGKFSKISSLAEVADGSNRGIKAKKQKNRRKV